ARAGAPRRPTGLRSRAVADGPLISILLPNRNHARYLPTSLEGLLTQTWKNIEVVVIDDASSDDSRDLVLRYASRDPRLRLLPLATQHGVNKAIREGLSTIAGEYLYIAAADDFAEPTLLEKSVTVLHKSRRAALCFSDPSELIEETGERRYFPLYLAEV